MARKRAKAVPRPKKWYEHTVVQILGIVGPVLALVFLSIYLATRQTRTRRSPKAEPSQQLSVSEAFFAQRPDGVIDPAGAEVSTATAADGSARARVDLEALEQQIREIRSDKRYVPATLNEVHTHRQDKTVTPAQQEDFENRLAGSRVHWQGIVEQINPRNDGSVELTIHSTDDEFHRAFLAFSRAQRRQLRLLRVDDEVEITGIVTSVVGWPFLEDCRILRSWKTEVEEEESPPEVVASPDPFAGLTQELGR